MRSLAIGEGTSVEWVGDRGRGANAAAVVGGWECGSSVCGWGGVACEVWRSGKGSTRGCRGWGLGVWELFENEGGVWGGGAQEVLAAGEGL